MNFIAFDLETTGVLAGVDRIVEIGALRFVDGQVEAKFSTLVDPEMAIPEAASRVNGISNDMVVGQPKIEDCLGIFAEFCQDLPLVAHNASFDYQFLLADIKKLEAKAPTGIIVDTYSMAKKIFPGLANYKLGTLIQHLEIVDTGGFHRAETDANYCGQLFKRLCERISGSSDTMPPLENLIALSGKGEIRFPQIIAQPKQLEFF